MFIITLIFLSSFYLNIELEAQSFKEKEVNSFETYIRMFQPAPLPLKLDRKAVFDLSATVFDGTATRRALPSRTSFKQRANHPTTICLLHRQHCDLPFTTSRLGWHCLAARSGSCGSNRANESSSRTASRFRVQPHSSSAISRSTSSGLSIFTRC